MIYTFRILISVMCVLGVFSSTAMAQDLVPPKSPESGELRPAKAGAFSDLRLMPDKPQIITLDRDVTNIIVGNTDHLAVTPDTARRLILIPRQPGATSLQVFASDGSLIMERHVIIAAPKSEDNYVRIRRSCVNGNEGCKEYSMYYCPNMCHKLGLVEDDSSIEQASETASSGDKKTARQEPTPPPLEPADGPSNTATPAQ